MAAQTITKQADQLVVVVVALLVIEIEVKLFKPCNTTIKPPPPLFLYMILLHCVGCCKKEEPCCCCCYEKMIICAHSKISYISNHTSLSFACVVFSLVIKRKNYFFHAMFVCMHVVLMVAQKGFLIWSFLTTTTTRVRKVSCHLSICHQVKSSKYIWFNKGFCPGLYL